MSKNTYTLFVLNECKLQKISNFQQYVQMFSKCFSCVVCTASNFNETSRNKANIISGSVREMKVHPITYPDMQKTVSAFIRV